MLYEVITLPLSEPPTQARSSRITSYNVCYTKLLRVGHGRFDFQGGNDVVHGNRLQVVPLGANLGRDGSPVVENFASGNRPMLLFGTPAQKDDVV